jgi:hypothetical protein
MSRAHLFILFALMALGASSAFAAHDKERVAENYLATYSGPTLFEPKKPQVLTDSFSHDDIETVIKNWFDNGVYKKTNDLNAALHKTNPVTYNTFLAAPYLVRLRAVKPSASLLFITQVYCMYCGPRQCMRGRVALMRQPKCLTHAKARFA